MPEVNEIDKIWNRLVSPHERDNEIAECLIRRIEFYRKLRALVRKAYRTNRVFDGKGDHWPEEADRLFETRFGFKP